MKTIYKTVLFFLFTSSCALEKEPLIPTFTNEEDPAFTKSIELISLSGETLLAKAEISTKGNLQISQHGWVWAEKSNPTIKDNLNKVILGKLEQDTFQTIISGLEIGKTYFIRPFISDGSGTVYGAELSQTMVLPKFTNLVTVNDSACYFEVKCNIQSSSEVIENGVLFSEGDVDPLLINDVRIKGGLIKNNIFTAQITNLKSSTQYTLRAFAKNKEGIGYSTMQQFKTKPSPQVSFGYTFNTDTILFQGAIVQFSNKSIGVNNCQWNFENGAPSKDLTINHTFNTIGEFTTKLEGEKEGCQYTKETKFKIITDPFADYWVKLPGGEFLMGCTPEQGGNCDPDESPVHSVMLSPFEIGKTEVTQEQWLAVMGYNAGFFRDCGPNCPVELVDVFNIRRNFIPFLNRKTGRTHRMTTEAEWEYAAKGGENYIYSGSNTLNEVGWYTDNSNQKIHPVGLKKPNGFGLYDMSGNVWEWCSDYYDPNYYKYSPNSNPTGPEDTPSRFVILRGGGFQVEAYGTRVSYRKSFSSVQPTRATGFRIVRIP